jgi:putative redox protein
MVTVTATYQGQLHCEATHQPSASILVTDAPKDNQGKGEAFSPTDLVGTAYVTCILTTMGIVARGLGVDMDGATGSVEKNMTTSPPRRIASLPVTIAMPPGIDPAHRAKLEQAGHHCPVGKSLHPDIDMSIAFIWN